MIYFENRASAGKILAIKLQEMAPNDPVVLGVAAGGIEVARQCAEVLGVPLDTIVSKKLYYPEEPDSIMGAIAEDGTYFIAENANVNYAAKTLLKTVEKSKEELARRTKLFREKRAFPELKNKTAIVIDEGIITGAAIVPLLEVCKASGAAEVWLASPLAGEGTCIWLKDYADKMVILEKPKLWQRIEDCYRTYRKLPKSSLIEMLG